jgi:hypothetical protein
MWDNPIMTVTADSRKRVIIPACKPGEQFDVQASGDGAFLLRRLEPITAPVVKPVRTKEGFIMLRRKLDRRLVAAAIRADRDSQ